MFDHKLSVVVIDDNLDLCKSISAFFEKTGKLEVIGVANDGETGYKAIIEKKPDVVILDILLPERDGISILEDCKITEMTKRPVFVMLTAVGQENITKRVLELGADYVILKPFSMDILVKRIVEHHEMKSKNGEVEYFTELPKVIDKEDYITEILQKIGIPINLKGYHYLKAAIRLCLNDDRLMESITKLLYPSVAKECNTTPSRVERDIRHCLEVAWSRGNGQYYYELIGYKSVYNEKPTNGAFISSIVEKFKNYFK